MLRPDSARGGPAWLSRYRRPSSSWHLLQGCQPRAEVRGSLPRLTALEGSPRCHRMPCGGSCGRIHRTAPYAALLPALNDGFSRREVLDEQTRGGVKPIAGPAAGVW